MEKKDFKICIFLVTFACTVSTSMAQKSTDELIKYVEGIDFNLNSLNQIEQYCYIKKSNFINRIGVIDHLKYGLIPSGTQILSLGYVLHVSKNYQRERIVIQKYNFEAGKSYQVRLIPEDSVFVFDEAPDNEVEYLKNLRDYTEAYPDRLTGTWSGEKKRLLNTFFIQYTIEGNKMYFEGKSKHAGMKAFVAEGELFYNENIIIMFPEKAVANGKNVENFSSQPKYVWYYTLTDGILHLEGGRLFGKGGLIWENIGDFRKIN